MTIEQFAKFMKRILDRHQPANGKSWQEMNSGELLCGLLDETEALTAAMESQDIAAILVEAVDVANYAYMIANRATSVVSRTDA